MKQAIHVADIRVEPGELALGKMVCAYRPDSSEVNLPLLLMNGAEDGPTLLLTCAMHGNEITGVEVIRRLLREIIDPGRLRGAILAAPIVNPFAFNAHQMVTPQDGLNINRVFPGDQSLLSNRIAHRVYQELVTKSDYLIDFHANANPAMEFSIVKEGRNREALQQSLAMADAFGITNVEMLSAYESHRAGTMVEAAANDGKPAIILELVYWRRQDPVSVQTGIRGTLNVMKHLGMLEGGLEKQTIPVIPGRLTRTEIRAEKGGFVQPRKGLGESIQKGETIGVIRDPWGDVVEEVVSPVDGWILAWPFANNSSCGTGDQMVMVVFPKEGAE